MIEALIFDFDGVIIDTETPDYQSWSEVFRSYGVTLDLSLWSGFIGTTLGGFDVVGHLEGLAGRRLDREAVMVQKRTHYRGLVEDSPILPGVTDYIHEAKRMGIKLGIASSSPRRWVEGNLVDRGLLEYFDSVSCSDDVARVKPDPELYLSAVSRLGTQPGKALAIEDSAHGVTAAKDAGLFCVVVPNPMTRHLAIDHADVHLNALSDIPLMGLMSKIAKPN